MFKRFRRSAALTLLVFLCILFASPLAAGAATNYAVEVLHYTGNTTVDSSNFETDLKAALTKLGVDASQVKYTNAITTQFNATDTFAWDKFTHVGWWNEVPFPKEDQNPAGSESNDHIVVKNGGKTITFYGYGWPAFKDFMFMANTDANSTKTFTFEFKEDSTDWHTLEGGGFLFNAAIDSDRLLSGYAILFAQSNIELFKISAVDVDKFHEEESRNMANYPGITLLKSFSKPTGSDHQLKIVAGPETVDMWDNGAAVISEYALPTQYGSGFGPIVSYMSHGCSSLSYLTFNDVKMSETKNLSLYDVINQAKWDSCSDHFVLNLQDDQVADFKDQATLNKILAKMSQDKAFYLGWGTEENQAQTMDFIQKNGNRGAFIDNTDESSVDKIAAAIADQLKADVAAAKAALTPGYASGNSASNVIKNLTLPANINGSCTTVSWTSSNPAVLSNTGVVTNPESGEVTVTLTATITKAGVTDTRQFTVVVKPGLVKTGSPIDTTTLTILGLALILVGVVAFGRRPRANQG